MTNLDRRINELERTASIGNQRHRVVRFHCEKPEDMEQAAAEAIARDEAEHGPLRPNEDQALCACGPAGQWADTPHGLRWRYPDGALTDDPTGLRHRNMAN